MKAWTRYSNLIGYGIKADVREILGTNCRVNETIFLKRWRCVISIDSNLFFPHFGLTHMINDVVGCGVDAGRQISGPIHSCNLDVVEIYDNSVYRYT